MTVTEEKDKTPEPAQDKPPERKLTHEEFMETLRRNPRFVVHEPTGEGFIMPWPGPVPPKKPEGDGA
jgi:hypothetical protein